MRPAFPVSLTVSASLIGDTFLYTVLPVSAARLGVEPLLVGVILSANRWVRLVTNPLAARLYEQFPAGRLILAAIVLGAISTALYVDPTWIVGIVAARLLWGFCFSLLRLGAVLAAIDEAGSRAGRLLGETRAIWGLGYLAGALYAPVAVEAIGWPLAIAGAALLTLAAGLGPALLAAPWRRAMRVHEDDPAPASVWHPRMLALFACGAANLVVGAGIVVVAGGIRISELYPDGAPVLGLALQATYIAGLFVLTQRFAQVLWQPVAGRLADRSLARTYVVGALLGVAGVAILALPVPATTFVAAAALFNVAGLTASLAAELAVARGASSADRPRVLAVFHTWQDGGAALGALAGGALAAIGTAFALAVAAALMLVTVPLWIFALARPRVTVPA
ncbi:MAG TPA: MFS transporter [Candidatus Limnocylindria bacterium]|nr:MFS transporter [Candidatus Limnocylindria bacterium]